MSQSVAVPAVGSRMATLRLEGSAGTSTTLDELRAGSRAVVFFLRASSCAICLAHARAISAMSAAGELGGATVVFVTPGDATEAKAAETRLRDVGATVWASGNAHAEVGLGKFLAIQHSGTFLTEADGTVLYSKTSTLPMGSFSKPELLGAIAG
jgi:peroxiredoxin